MFGMKLCRKRTCELMRDFRRYINKTSTDKNSYAISMAQHNKIGEIKLDLHCNKNVNIVSWMKQMQCNNMRSFATIQPTMVESLAFKKQYRDFMAMFSDIRELNDAKTSQELPDVMRRFDRVLEYNSLPGKTFGGMILVSSYKLLDDPQKLTPENIKLATILGWCYELIEDYLIIIDDIFDDSKTRRGLPCWYRLPDIGLSAGNDAEMIKNAVWILLKKYFRDHPAYTPLIELFQDGLDKSHLGQSFEFMFAGSNGKPKLEMFTMDRYFLLTKYKAYVPFIIPVRSAMYMVGIHDEELHRQANIILLEMGQFYQAQNDFLDYYGDPAVIGKIGADIEIGQCSWLSVAALQKATPAQRKIMEEHYGRPEPESIKRIQRLYHDLCLLDMYTIYKEKSRNTVKTLIQQISKHLNPGPFFEVMEKLYAKEY